jgi:hypothetical protein
MAERPSTGTLPPLPEPTVAAGDAGEAEEEAEAGSPLTSAPSSSSERGAGRGRGRGHVRREGDTTTAPASTEDADADADADADTVDAPPRRCLRLMFVVILTAAGLVLAGAAAMWLFVGDAAVYAHAG